MSRPENLPPLSQAYRELAAVRRERAASELAAQEDAYREIRENLRKDTTATDVKSNRSLTAIRSAHKTIAAKANIRRFEHDPFTKAQTEKALRFLSTLPDTIETKG